jgi:hypothetical protein
MARFVQMPIESNSAHQLLDMAGPIIETWSPGRGYFLCSETDNFDRSRGDSSEPHSKADVWGVGVGYGNVVKLSQRTLGQ